MGRTPIYSAVLIALLGVAPSLLAENAADGSAPTTAAAPAPVAEGSTAAASMPAAESSTDATMNTAENTPATTTTTPQSKGDTLALPKSEPARTRKKAAHTPVAVEVDGMPGRGASMKQVEKQFGKPKRKLAPVGKPPITRWVYDNYTVYFEYEYVIDSVENDKPAPAMPKPAPKKAAPPVNEMPPAAPQGDAPMSNAMPEPAGDANSAAPQEPAGDAPSSAMPEPTSEGMPPADKE